MVQHSSARPAVKTVVRTDAIPCLGRQFADSVVILALAVMMCRAFAAEGYMISTGSMAPCLLGYHRQVTCPACGFHFARGMAVPESEIAQWSEKNPLLAQTNDQSAAGESSEFGDLAPPSVSATVCPNCGKNGILAGNLPRNEGDQLMVNKAAYGGRDPHRWEVVVFRNPQDPEQAYVKRLVGLPGEKIEIWEGDLYANGEIQRKPAASQRGARIIVDDHQFTPPLTDDWEPRWGITEPSPTNGAQTAWQDLHGRFVFSPTSATDQEIHWVNYRHWIRSGGEHRTRVPLAEWPKTVETPHPTFSRLQYDQENQLLSYVGAMPTAERQKWAAESTDPQFLAALDDLYGESHVAPATDIYGYNHPDSAPSLNPVRDLMVELNLEYRGDATAENAAFVIEMSDDGRRRFRTVLDFAAGELRLLWDSRVLRKAPLASYSPRKPVNVMMSLFDRQVTVTLDDVELFEPWPIPSAPTGEVPRQAVRLGASGGALAVNELRIYRDVYYTAKRGGKIDVTLSDDEFFVLGDNSPVSIDSRYWDNPAIHRHDLIGKPFVVHLPSQQRAISLGGTVRYIRTPDFSSMRLIR